MWAALVLSLALNLLVVGMAAATMFHFRKSHGGDRARFSHYIETLPEDRRQKITAVLSQQRQLIRPLRKQVREARRRAAEAFAAEPFSREDLLRASDEAAEARIALTNARRQWFPRIAELLTAEERREYMKWRHRHSRYHHRRWRPPER
jgi:uncharacterized membrane protein